MKNSLSTIGLTLMAGALSAQSLDLNFSNSNEALIQEPDYEGWIVKQLPKDSTTLENGLKIIMEATGNATVLRSQWHKNTCTAGRDNGQTGARLMGDGVVAFIADGDNNTPQLTDTPTSITVTIRGLEAGEHSLAAYHVWKDPKSGEMPKIQVAINDSVVLNNVEFANVKSTVSELKMADAPFSYVEFEVEEGENVAFTYTTIVESGKTYQTTNVMLNGLLIDRSPLIAMDPEPSHQDFHIDADNGTYTLSWAAASVAVKHKLAIATSEEALADAAYAYEGSETSYTVEGLNSWTRYYWRVDEEDADGKTYTGNVWSFQPRQLAFPEAEGYGRYARGGRGGVVYHVTNLKHDHEPGSLLYGLVDLTGPRTIVFDVSGTIEMDFGSVFIQPYATIAAQTAPGKGICLKASNINVGADVICRFVRFKRGLGVYGENTGNAMGMSGANHSIVDHCTAAWGTDETVSGRGGKNITFQYSGIFEALGITGHKNYSDGTNHGYAATIDGQIGSWHHNLLANCAGRNWSMGGGMDANNIPIGGLDLFNNVVYNWNSRTTDGNCHAVNFVNNYYKMGADTKQTILFTQDFEGAINAAGVDQAYVNGNIRENKDHSLTVQTYALDKKNDIFNARASNGGSIPTTYEYQVSEPLFESYATIHTAKDAFKIVNSYAGAIMPVRDDHHKRIVKETINGTYTYVGSKSGIKGEIDNEEDAGGFENYPEEHRAADFDTDQDGIPNWFENIIGTDPASANNNADPDGDGWTQLEDYLEFMAHPYSVLNAGEEATVDVSEFFAGFTKSPSYSVSVPTGSGVTANVSGSSLTVKGGSNSEVIALTLTVTDSEGTTWSQRYNVAVAGQGTGIESISADDSASTDATTYDLFGRKSRSNAGFMIRDGKIIKR
ncbi:MAG: T9SS C-terminal target domain-containing protein [Bacteroidales bacterium]|jgi:hypothetical protein|nr:T9SS C-terminal target domain-containing protein [Bacteroidales bacterium]